MRGFSLVEVLVTLGVTSVLILGVMEFANLSAKGTRGVELSVRFNSMASSVELVLNNQTACTKALAAKPYDVSLLTAVPPTPINIGSITLTGGDIAKVGAASADLLVTKLEFDKLMMDLGMLGPNEHAYMTNVHLEATKKGAVMGGKLLKADMSVTLRVNTALKTIVQCE